jgi:hypothetical protein
MTIQEFYQEMKEQEIEEIKNGYLDNSYDDFYTISIEIDYTVQE